MNGTQGSLYVMEAALLLIGVIVIITLPWRQEPGASENPTPRRTWLESPPAKRVWVGILNAIAAAFLLPMVYMSLLMFSQDLSGDPIVIPWFAVEAVVLTSWFVVPVGGIVGAFMPRWIGQRRGRAAMVRGMVIGFWVGLVVALGTVVTLNTWVPGDWPPPQLVVEQVVIAAVFLTTICEVWVGIYAWRWSDVPRTIIPTDGPVWWG